MSTRNVRRSVRRRVLGAATGVLGATAVLASPAAAGVEEPVTLTPTTGIVANSTVLQLAWTDGPSGPLTVELCDLSLFNGCTTVHSEDFVNSTGSATFTIPGSVNGKKCYDTTSTFDIFCMVEVNGGAAQGTPQFQVIFSPPSSK